MYVLYLRVPGTMVLNFLHIQRSVLTRRSIISSIPYFISFDSSPAYVLRSPIRLDQGPSVDIPIPHHQSLMKEGNTSTT